MRKLIIGALLFTLLLSMTGCCCPLIAEKEVSPIERPYYEPIQKETSYVGLATEPPDETESFETEAPETEPALETEAPTEPPVAQSTVSLSQGDLQRRINVFLSNFSEAYFYEYPCDNFELLHFAYIHALINGDGETNYDGNSCYMPEDDVNGILNKYFGTTFPENAEPHSFYLYTEYGIHSVDYDGDYYWFEAGAGEFYGRFAIARSMQKNGDGTYTIEFGAFDMKDMWGDDPKNYYSLSYDQAINNSAISLTYTGTAVVKDYTRPGGTQSYQLIRLNRN